MRFHFTASLLVLNVLAFGLIALINQKSENANAEPKNLFGGIKQRIAKADHIALHGPSIEKRFVLTRHEFTWEIIEPIRWNANHFAVERMLSQLQFIQEKATFSIREIKKNGQNLSDYGLDPPLLQLEIGNAKDFHQILIGGPTEIGDNVYLLDPNKDQVHVIARQTIDSFFVDPNDLRSPNVFDIPVFEIEAIDLRIHNAEIPVDREIRVRIAQINNGWILETPINVNADTSNVSNLINELSTIKVKRFIEPDADNSELQGLETPFMQVVLEGNGRRQTLLVGNEYPSPSDSEDEPAYFARLDGNPAVFTVPATPFDKLQKTQKELRERNFMHFDSNEIHSIHITEDDIQVRLQKLETGEWQIVHSEKDIDIIPRRADDDTILELLKTLSNLRATDFASDNATPADIERFGFHTPRRIVNLIHSDGHRTELILAHPKQENRKLYARIRGTDFIYKVDRRPTLEALSLNPLEYRNRTLDTLAQAARIQSVKLESLDNATTLFEYAREDPSISWETLLAKETESHRQAILRLIEDLRDFKVENYLIDHYTDGYPLDDDTVLPWSFRLSAKIFLPGDGGTMEDSRNYVFTKRMSGTQQTGGSVKHDSVFQIRQATLDALYALTDHMTVPPEAKGETIPEPPSFKALPDPASFATKEDG